MTNSTTCKLLVSANSIDECDLLQKLGTPWIDLKEPRNGPLGRASLETVARFSQRMNADPLVQNWSIAGGELVDWDLSKDQPFLHPLGETGHIKWGLCNCQSNPAWAEKLAQLLPQLPSPQQAILVHYADHSRVDAAPWDQVLEVAAKHRIDKLLIDTAIKDGRTLLDWLPAASLSERINSAHRQGFQIAIAGSIPMGSLSQLCRLTPDWIGVRGAVCSMPTERSSPIDPQRVKEAIGLVMKPMGRPACGM